MLKGSCLCGGVEYESGNLIGPIGHCHCATCRKAHSAGFTTTSRVDRDSFVWTTGSDLLRSYESSPGKLRHFCGRCGSHLMAEWKDQDSLILRLGTLDTDPGQVPEGHIWTSHDVAWLEYRADLPEFEKGVPK